MPTTGNGTEARRRGRGMAKYSGPLNCGLRDTCAVADDLRMSPLLPWSKSSRPSPIVPRVALVTGGGSGMGQLAVWRLAESGAAVGALDINSAGLDETAARFPGLIRPITVDVTDEAAVNDAVDEIETHLGPIDRVMNAAGVAQTVPLLDHPPAQIKRMMTINYFGTVNVSAATLPRMLERRRGQLINFASLLGLVGAPNLGAYVASKAAVIAYTEALWSENRDCGVRIMCYCPPAVSTPMFSDFIPEAAQRKTAQRLRLAITPERALDSLESATGDKGFLIVPTAVAQIMWWMRRQSPGLMGKLMSISTNMQGGDHPAVGPRA
jgi:NAD(P)-dependent dehydrogenase (short-subunit alcohol dehydrogenase family)